MTRDQPGPRRDFLERFGNVADVATNVTAAVKVYVGKATGEKGIAEVNDICSGEMDDAITIGVPGRRMNDFDFFAIKVNGQGFIEGDDGEFRPGFAGFAAESFADIRVRNDVSFAAKVSVTAGVIPVEVGVEDEFEGARIQFFQGGRNLVCQGCKLIVDDQYSVRPDGDADVSAGTGQHVDIAGDLGGFNLDGGEIRLRLRGVGKGKQERGNK